MAQEKQLEFWLRGPLPGIIPILQPVAHAIRQAQLEVHEILLQFPDDLIWERPAGVASIAFHLQHISGILDRLFTYARGEQLSEGQLAALQKEGLQDDELHLNELLHRFDSRVETAIEQLKGAADDSVMEARNVGRKQIPSTVLGLLFHAAEHTQRHTGQLLVTARVLTGVKK